MNDWQWPLIRQGYDNKDILNADETGLLFKMMPSKTLSMKEEAYHGAKYQRKDLPCVYVQACLAKKGCYNIGKYLRPRCFKNKNLERILYIFY